MAVLNDKQRQIGKDNYEQAVRVTRRQVLTGAVGVPAMAASMYYGYEKVHGKPVKTGIIGTGNQGNYAHISQSNPDYIEFTAFCDIRPSSVKRARRTFAEKYGRDQAKKIKYYEKWEDLIADPEIEMVIVVLPLHLHARVTIAALKAGKHVLCEKLMAKNVAECTAMVKTADAEKKLLAIGHQRHYSYLYHNCLSLIQREDKGVLGDIRHIRAWWHRNSTNNGAPGAEKGFTDGWKPAILPEDNNDALAQKFGYKDAEQMVRWRLDNATGGGLIVELGSHQLDAASIFLGMKHPVAVQGVGKVSFFEDDREVFDHIFLMYEYGEDADDAVVTYSSIMTNAFDGYGEQVMGTKGTLVVQQENDAYVFKEGAGKDTRVRWAEGRVSRPVVEAGSTKAWAVGTDTPDTLTSRGYREEQEHMAWLIRNPDKIQWPSEDEKTKDFHPDLRYFPRCHGRVGLDDAVIALCSNLAMEKQKRIVFKKEWFDPYSASVPENEV